MKVDLNLFCRINRTWFLAMDKPWKSCGWQYASDGIACVRAPTNEPIDKHLVYMAVERWFDPVDRAEKAVRVPKVSLEDDSRPGPTCSACKGTNVMPCHICRGYGRLVRLDEPLECVCDTCGGTGRVTPCTQCDAGTPIRLWRAVRLDGRYYGAGYIWLLSRLPGLRYIGTCQIYRGLVARFDFDGGEAIVLETRNRGRNVYDSRPLCNGLTERGIQTLLAGNNGGGSSH